MSLKLTELSTMISLILIPIRFSSLFASHSSVINCQNGSFFHLTSKSIAFNHRSNFLLNMSPKHHCLCWLFQCVLIIFEQCFLGSCVDLWILIFLFLKLTACVIHVFSSNFFLTLSHKLYHRLDSRHWIVLLSGEVIWPQTKIQYDSICTLPPQQLQH